MENLGRLRIGSELARRHVIFSTGEKLAEVCDLNDHANHTAERYSVKSLKSRNCPLVMNATYP